VLRLSICNFAINQKLIIMVIINNENEFFTALFPLMSNNNRYHCKQYEHSVVIRIRDRGGVINTLNISKIKLFKMSLQLYSDLLKYFKAYEKNNTIYNSSANDTPC